MAFEVRRGQAARFGLALLGAMTLAGCALVPRGGSERPPAAEPEPQQAPAVAEDEPGPSLPAGETRNRVAVLVPLSGSNAAVGQAILNAANLALLDSGTDRFAITAYDTARGAVVAANEALADGNGLFLGPLLADDARAVGPLAQRARVPVIAFSNDVSIAGEGVYILGLNPAQSIARVVEFARERGARRFGALLPANVYGERAAPALAAAVARSGGTLSVETYDRSAGSTAAAAVRLNAEGPYDAVLIADAPRTAALAVPVLRRSSPEVRILGTELWASEALPAALRGAWFAGPADTRFEQLRTRYRARFRTNPHRLASLGYDSVLLAVRLADEWRLGRAFPARLLRDPNGFSGIDGAFRFRRDGVAERALEVLEVTAAGTTVVSPAASGFDD
jgi:ABC-type branched-subunit amino acid transport system substrate-binding protein